MAEPYSQALTVISVIIPTKNRSKMLLQCVESLLDQKANNYEIIVVADGSVDDTQAVINSLIESHPQIKYISNKSSKGSYFRRNQGVDNSKGEILAFIDDDCIAPSSWLSTINEIFKSKEVDAVQGIANLPYSQGFWIKLESARIAYDPKYFWVDTKNFAVRKDIFLELGGFDKDFKSSGDVAFGIHLQARNKNLVLSEKLKVFHHVENNPIKLLWNVRRYARGDYLLSKNYRKGSIFEKINQTLSIPRYGLEKMKANTELNGFEKAIFLLFYIIHYLIRDSFFYIYTLKSCFFKL